MKRQKYKIILLVLISLITGLIFVLFYKKFHAMEKFVDDSFEIEFVEIIEQETNLE